MPRIADAASLAALESPMPGGMPPMDPAMMAPPPGGAPMPGGDVEGAFSTIEAGLADAPPDQAEEARAHVNALREIFANIGGEGAPPPAEEPMPNPDEVPPPTEGG